MRVLIALALVLACGIVAPAAAARGGEVMWAIHVSLAPSHCTSE
jgi:hypothetical protein